MDVSGSKTTNEGRVGGGVADLNGIRIGSKWFWSWIPKVLEIFDFLSPLRHNKGYLIKLCYLFII